MIVLQESGDLAHIRWNYKGMKRMVYYQPDTEFLLEISQLLPPSKEHWWERLGESGLSNPCSSHNCCAAAKCCQREVPPQTSTSAVPKVRHTIPQQSEDAKMEDNLLQDDQLEPVSAYSLLLAYLSPSFLGPQATQASYPEQNSC
jgi:hypothetical protein